jgi:hypothetical protein
MNFAQRLHAVLALSEPTGIPDLGGFPKVTFRDQSEWEQFVRDQEVQFQKKYQVMPVDDTCSKGIRCTVGDQELAVWDRATNSGWSYSLKNLKVTDTTQLDQLVQELRALEFQAEQAFDVGRSSAGYALSEKVAALRGQIYKEIRDTDQPERQALAVRYQQVFAPNRRDHPQMVRFHKGLGTQWEPYAAPFDFKSSQAIE